MIHVFPARRRADEFAQLVEAGSTSELDDARFADLLELVRTMETAPATGARPAFVTGLRERLMVEAESALAGQQTERLLLPQRRPARDRRIAAAVGSFALVGVSASVAMAAQSALPGDVLYPVKRALENVETRVQTDDVERGNALLANAAGRLDEVAALSRSTTAVDALAVAATLDDFTEQATEASELLLDDYAATGNQEALTGLRAFTATSLTQLTALEPVVPLSAYDELQNAARVLLGIDAAARQACPPCGGGITEIPPIFASLAAVSGTAATQVVTPGSGATSPGSAGQPSVPNVDQSTLPPGSVLSPDNPEPAIPNPSPGVTLSDPLSGLVGGGTSQPSAIPTVPGTGGVSGGTGDVVGGTTGTVDGVVDGVEIPKLP